MPATISATITQQQKKTSNALSHGPPAGLLNTLEALSWLFCTMIYFTWYNPIGELGRLRDDSANPTILRRIDDELHWMTDLVPYVPAMIFPYVLVYGMPLAYLASIYYTCGLSMAMVRRFFLTQMALITAAFAVYLTVPCKTDLLFNAETQQYEYGADTWIGRLCFQHVHQGISLYVAFPSMHTAHAWSIAAAFSTDNLRGSTAMWALAVTTLFSTCMTKAHHPPHCVAGLALAYAGQKLVFEPLTRNLQQLEPCTATWARFYAATIAPVVLILVGEELHRVSGWSTDVPAMFGFERNPVLGLYGFRS